MLRMRTEEDTAETGMKAAETAKAADEVVSKGEEEGSEERMMMD